MTRDSKLWPILLGLAAALFALASVDVEAMGFPKEIVPLMPWVKLVAFLLGAGSGVAWGNAKLPSKNDAPLGSVKPGER